jgi:hypothetical protein
LLHRYCYLPLSWKSWNRIECAVGGVRHPQHTQTGVCGLSGCGVHDQTNHRQVHRTHIHIDGIRPHTEKANDEASSRKVVNALSTKDDPWGWSYNNDRNT